MPQYTREQIQSARARALEAGNQAAVQQADALLAKFPDPAQAANGAAPPAGSREAEIQRLSDPNNWTEQDIQRGLARAQAAGNWDAMLKFNEIRERRFGGQEVEGRSAMDRLNQMFSLSGDDQRMNENGVLEIGRNIMSGKDLVDRSLEGAARTFAGKFTQRAGGAAQAGADFIAPGAAEEMAADERTMEYLRRRSPEMAARIEEYVRRVQEGELTEEEVARRQRNTDIANQLENYSKLLYQKGQDQLQQVEELRPEGFMAGLTFDAANVLAYMGEGALASIVTRNPNAGLVSMYSLVAGSEYNVLRNEGYERTDAMVRANLQALYETVPEKLFGVFDRIAGKGAAGRLIQAGAEGASEAVTEMATILDEYARGEFDGNIMDALERVGYAALVGSVAGVFLPGGRQDEIDLTTVDKDRSGGGPNRDLDDLNEAEGRQTDGLDGEGSPEQEDAPDQEAAPEPTITILEETDQTAPEPDALDRARQQEPVEAADSTDRTARPEVKRNVDPETDGVFAETGRHTISGRPVSYGLVFPGNLGVDPDTYQYKATDDAEGRTDRFSGEEEWSPTAAGEVIVHRRADGDFIADGHQRRGLARAARERGQDPADLQSRAIILDEADGWSAGEVRLFAAMQNIKQETGTAVDAAKVMREGGPELREEMARHMNPRRASWRDAEGLSRLSQDVFDNVVAERLKPEHGAAIGQYIEDDAKQLAANKYFMENPPATREEAESIARDINRMEAQQGGGQGDMFGDMLAELPLAERAAILKEAKKKARTLRRTFNALVRNQALIEGGDASNVLDKDGNARVANDATVVTDLLNRLVDTSPELNEVLNEEANKLAAGETTRSAAADRIFAEAERLSASLSGRGADQEGDGGAADGREPRGSEGQEVPGEVRPEAVEQPAEAEREQDDGAAPESDEVNSEESDLIAKIERNIEELRSLYPERAKQLSLALERDTNPENPFRQQDLQAIDRAAERAVEVAKAEGVPKPNPFGVYDKEDAETLSLQPTKSSGIQIPTEVYALEVLPGVWVSAYSDNRGGSPLVYTEPLFASKEEAFSNELRMIARRSQDDIDEGRTKASVAAAKRALKWANSELENLGAEREETNAGPEATPEAPAAEEAPKPKTGKRTGKPFTLKSLLGRKDQETLAELRADTMGSRMGAVLAEVDSAMRAVEKQLRDKGEQFTPGDNQDTQEGVWLQTALVHVQDLLELHRDHGAEVVWPERDENGDAWQWPEGFNPEMGDPIFYAPLDVLEHLDVAMEMGFPVDAATMEGMGDPLPGDGRPVRMDPADVFPDAEETRSVDTELKGADQLTLEEAQARVQSWKDAAAAIGEQQDNSNKVVISLFDFEGSWSQPWEDAGYTVLRYDIKTGSDILIDDWFWNRIEELRESGMEIYGVLSACPCTTFASASGAQWWKKRHDVESEKYLVQTFGSSAPASGAKSAGEYNLMLVQATRDVIEAANPTGFHVLENPIGRINTSLSKKTGLKTPILRFHPHNFGDPYTKRTQIWGAANIDLPTANVDPALGSKMQNTLRGDKAIDKEARSITPEGFSYAFFMANHPGAMAGATQETTNDDVGTQPQPAAEAEDVATGGKRRIDIVDSDGESLGEGPFDSIDDALEFVSTEVGVPVSLVDLDTGKQVMSRPQVAQRTGQPTQREPLQVIEGGKQGEQPEADTTFEPPDFSQDPNWSPPEGGMTREQIRDRAAEDGFLPGGYNKAEAVWMFEQDPIGYMQGRMLKDMEPGRYGPEGRRTADAMFLNNGIPTQQGITFESQRETAQQALDELVDQGLVEKDGQSYRLAMPEGSRFDVNEMIDVQALWDSITDVNSATRYATKSEEAEFATLDWGIYKNGRYAHSLGLTMTDDGPKIGHLTMRYGEDVLIRMGQPKVDAETIRMRLGQWAKKFTNFDWDGSQAEARPEDADTIEGTPTEAVLNDMDRLVAYYREKVRKKGIRLNKYDKFGEPKAGAEYEDDVWMMRTGELIASDLRELFNRSGGRVAYPSIGDQNQIENDAVQQNVGEGLRVSNDPLADVPLQAFQHFQDWLRKEGQETTFFKAQDTGQQEAQDEQTEEAGADRPRPDRPGPADAGADGAVGSGGTDGQGVRPPLRVASAELLPEPTAHVGNDSYDGGLDEGQQLGVNLALDRFEAGGRGFMLADGTGTGKTRQMLAIADQYRRRTGKPVLIVTENASIIADAFEGDARAMGINLADFETTTYSQVRAEKAGQGAYGLVIFDEAHNLKNQESDKTVAANAISADHRMFATATPLDKITGAVYFLSEITGIEPKQIYDQIGIEVRVDTEGKRAKQYPVPKEGVAWSKIAANLIELRNKAIQDGAFIRREYPFFGTIEDDGQFQITKEQEKEQEKIWDYWQSRIDSAGSKKAKGNLSGQRMGELSRWAEAQKKEAIFRHILSELSEGRSVVVIAEGVNSTTIKGLGGKEEPGLIGWLADELKDQGIDFGQIYGAGKSKKIKAAADFQSGKVRVVLATPKSGGTGINLDDVAGDAPRTMIVATANYSGDVFDQIMGRVSRRNTASPARIINVSAPNAVSDQRRGVILKKKLAALRAIQAGADVDEAYLDDSQVEDGQIRFMFAGPKAEGADRGRLQAAYKMAMQGADPEQIRQETGWHKGPDGNWRFEIDDSEGTVASREEIVNEIMTDDGGYKIGMAVTTLDRILDHPALFRAYPQLRRLEVILDAGGGDWASYNSGGYSGPYIRIGVNDDGVNRGTLLHEIQHAIQHREGFARGGNPNEFTDAVHREDARRWDAEQQLKDFERGVLDGKTLYEITEERNEQVLMGLIKKSEAQEAIEEASRRLDELFDNNSEISRLLEIAQRPVLSNRQRYARLAGEIEARNTQARSQMTAEERAATPPEETQDIASEKAIIRYHQQAVQAQSRPIPIDGAEAIADHLNQRLAGWGDARRRVRVVQREDQLPVEIQREIINQGAEGEIAGVYFAGQVYLVADNISTVERAETVLLHELKGHFALRDMVGQELKTVLERVYNSYGRRGLRDVIEARFPEGGPRTFDPQNQNHRLEVAEEHLAGLAESDPKHRWVRRAMATIRDWLRRLGFRFGLNDTDLIGLMARASEHIEARPSVRDASGLPTWARADHLPPMRPTWAAFGDTISAYSVEQLRRLAQAVAPNEGWSRMNRAELESEMRARVSGLNEGSNDPMPIEAWEALQGNAIRFSELEQQGLFGEEPSRTQQDLEKKRLEIEEKLKGGTVPVEDGDGDLFNPNPNNQRPLFALKEPGPTKRALRGLGSAAWWVLNQPAKLASGANWTVDQLLLSPMRVLGGVDQVNRSKLGISIANRVEDAITEGTVPGDNVLSNAINSSIKIMRHGFIDRYGQPAEYVERDRERTREQARIMTVLQTILKRLQMEGIDAKEARVLQDILEGKPTSDERLKRVSEPIRRTIDDLGYELVQLGYLDEATWQKNLGSYLHRSYAKHEGDLSDLPGLSRKILGRNSRSLVGDQLKARGILHDVKMEHLERVTPPEWWGRKKRNGKADKSLKGTMWTVLEKTKGPDPAQTGTQTDEELQMERKTRVIDRVWVPAENGIPKGYEGWDNRGTFEVMNVDGDTITMRRDYTEAEQEAMGKVMDARYNLIRTFQLFAHDISSGRFFEDIAKNDQWAVKKPPAGAQVTHGKKSSGRNRGLSVAIGYDWVQVPEDTIPGTRTKRWGALAGMYVRPEIWIDMNELDKASKKGLWDSVMTHWKLNKTARNPVVHMNNVMSNLVLMDLIDVSVVDLMDAIESYVQKDLDHIEAQKAGAYGQMFVDEELNRNALDPIIREMRAEARKADNSIQGRAKFLWTAMDKLYRGVRSADDAFIQMYQAEDAVFRLATFKKYRRHGYSAEESATIAVEQFLNYDIRAPWVNAMRRSFWPFISYTYRAVPAVAKAIAHRPHKFAKMVIIGYILNMLAYEMSGDDEEEERETLPGRLKGMTWARIPGTDIGLHRMLKLPVKDEYDQSLFLDITRWMPAGDVFDLSGAMPAWLSIGGPAVVAGELVANRSLFTRDEIYNRDLGSVDARLDFWNMPQVQDAAGHAWRSYAPGALFIPGTWHYDKIKTAIEGGSDIMNRQYSVPAAVASGLGVKVRPHDPETALFFRASEIRRQLSAAQQEISSARRRYSRGLITKEEMEDQVKLLERRARTLRESAEEDLRRD